MTIPPPVEILGIVAIATMVVCYALERRGTVFIAAFAAGCALAAVYAYLIPPPVEIWARHRCHRDDGPLLPHFDLLTGSGRSLRAPASSSRPW